MSENRMPPPDELDPVQAALDRALSRRTLIRRAALGGAALSTPALLAACDLGGGEDDENGEAAATNTQPQGTTGPQRDLTFYSVTHGESGSAFWAIYRNGIRDAQRVYGVTVRDLPLEQFSVAEYVDLLTQAIASQPDGLFCSILDQKAVDRPLREAIEAGIPVIAVNVPDTRKISERIPYLFYVGGDDRAGGRLTAQRQLQDGDVTHAVCIIDEPGHIGHEGRRRGYEAVLRSAGAQVDNLQSSKDATQATEQIKSYLQANPDVDAIFGVAPRPATFALQALEEVGRKGDVRVSAYDLTEGVLTEIAAGNLVSTIDQQQYLQGYEPIHWLTQHIEHGFVLAPGVDMLTGPALVDKSNSAKVAEGAKAGFR